MKNEYFECSCFSPEHTLLFKFDEDEIYVYVFLDSDGFLRRIWKAIKYVFGYKCKYGHFDEFILSKKDADKLSTSLKKWVYSAK